MKSLATVFLLLFIATTVASGSVTTDARANVKPDFQKEKPGTKDIIKARFDVRPGGTLYIDIDRGLIDIEASGDDEVYVELVRDVRGVSSDEEKAILEQHEYDISKDGNNVVIESRFDADNNGSWSWKRLRKKKIFKLTVTIRVPERYNIDFENGAGNVEIADLDGTVVGRTGAGNIVVGDINGPVDISSGAGNIDIESVVGYVDVRTGAGNITIDKVAGEIDAQTGAGNVVATVTRQPREDSDLGSGAGNVTVYLAEDIAVDVEAHSSLGSASCDFDLRVKGKWMSKSFGGELNGGGPLLTLHSGVGNVSLKRY
ncbi:MAG: DUF4097 family beta strand repeat-containing protein [Rhodothermia bacterium]|nr:MAG: DUF4097 family beta strand repeat-containing protein [Rhodothermia bacterium]